MADDRWPQIKEPRRAAIEREESPATGTTVSHYELLEILGEGGMGTVFKARDTHLNRFAALKFLRADGIADAEQKRRFVQEARTASLFQHPNIVHIYDVDETVLVQASTSGASDDVPAETTHFIAMEFVPGETLAATISAKRLDLQTVLEYAVQIASALTAAHRAGIIHRDLKPGNIIVNKDGVVKVLDFGLAKPVHLASPHPDCTTKSMQPTTHEGVVLGTSAYMSPEQVEGKRLDARSDIFSFGAVLYEMITGTRAFQGESDISVMSAVLRETPVPPEKLRPDLPIEVAQIVNGCLEKNPELRYPSAGDLHRDLAIFQTRLDGNEPTQKAGIPAVESQQNSSRLQRKHWGRFATTIAGVLAVAGALTWLLVLRSTKPPRELKPQQITTNASENFVENGVISPDGKSLLYGDQIGIHLRQIDTGETHTFGKPKVLSATDLWFPTAWFPDGSRFVAVSQALTPQGEVTTSWAASVVGGDVNRVRDNAYAQSISPDGALIAFTPTGANQNQEIWITGPRGEDARRILAGGETTFFDTVQWAPRGQRLVYLRMHSPENYIEASDYPEAKLETCNLKGEVRPVNVPNHLYAACPLRWLPDGRIVYVVFERMEKGYDSSFNWSNNLWQIRVDPLSGKPQGQPRRLTNWLHFCASGLSTSGDGTRMALLKDVWQYGVSVGQIESDGRLRPLQRMTLEESNNVPIAWTPDSKAVIFISDRNGTNNVYKQSLNQTEAEPLVTGPEAVSVVRVSPDGRWFLYISKPKTGARFARLMRVSTDGGPPEFITKTDPLADISCPTSPATQCLLLEVASDITQEVFTNFDPVRGKGRELFRIHNLRTRRLGGGQLSPDGSQIAMFENGSRDGIVRIMSLAGNIEQEIKLAGWRNLSSLDWSTDGKSFIVSVSGPSGCTLLRVTRAGTIQAILSIRGTGDQSGAIPSPDGRYLAIAQEVVNRNVWLLENF